MSLIECHECKNQVSDEAAACPKCGAKVRKPAEPKKPMSRAMTLFMALGAVALIGGMVAQETAQPRTPDQIAADKEQAARAMIVRMAVGGLKKAARDPDSLVVESARTNKDGTVVCLEYRARNGFGGMNREHLAIADGKAGGTPGHWNKHCTQKLFDMTTAAK